MTENGEMPEDRRERLRQQELHNNSLGNLSDAHHRAGSGSLVDLFNGLSWKASGIIILILIIGAFILLTIF